MIINYKKDFIEKKITRRLFNFLMYKDVYGRELTKEECVQYLKIGEVSYYKLLQEYKNYSNIQLEQPDKPCLRCDHNNRKSLIVVDKTEKGGKVVLCKNCLTSLAEI